jgi:TrmH family RNA methyltransferase
MTVKITSTRNPTYKEWMTLRTHASSKKTDGASAGRRFLLSGVKLVGEAVSAGLVESLIVADDLDSLSIYQDGSADYTIYEVPKFIIDNLADTKTPQGVMAVCRYPEPADRDMLGERVIALDGVQDPGNVGTIIRTADAAGMTGVFLGESCADPFSSKVIRSATGSVFRMKICHGNIAQYLASAKESGASILVSAMEGKPYSAVKPAQPWVLVIGSEGRGVSRDAFALATETVSVPMRGQAESLNAAVAAGILMFGLVDNRDPNS